MWYEKYYNKRVNQWWVYKCFPVYCIQIGSFETEKKANKYIEQNRRKENGSNWQWFNVYRANLRRVVRQCRANANRFCNWCFIHWSRNFTETH